MCIGFGFGMWLGKKGGAQFGTALKLKAAHSGCGGNVLLLYSLVDDVAAEESVGTFMGFSFHWKNTSFNLDHKKKGKHRFVYNL